MLPLMSGVNKLNSLNKIAQSFPNTTKMPVLFIGHGNPMNAIEENEFVQGFRDISQSIPKPKAIICISAHWETKGTYITAMANPKTIHDFGGFPKELYEVQYPAPGNPQLAEETQDLFKINILQKDYDWGLDHGAWSVIKHMYPNADIPVLELSLDYTKPAQYHYDLASQLSALRSKGVLIIGSGNMVHNLRKVAWDKLYGAPYGYDWAIEADAKMKGFILNDDHKNLINFRSQGEAFDLAIPTPEHYLPLIYTIALKNKADETYIFNDKPVAGSMTMTSVKFG
ncbi:MAG: 4,5-DOPA dioxygenase extradiol [Saprospiraceae bacterium]